METISSKNGKLYCGETEFLLRGFGLGGWFLPEGYMWKFFKKCDRPRKMEALILELCGMEYDAKFWKAYYDTYITEEDIRLIAERGFNSVRLPINARHLMRSVPSNITHTDTCSHPNWQVEFQTETIERIDRLIEWCKKYNLYVILDMHGAPGGQTGQNIDDSEHDKPELFLDIEQIGNGIKCEEELIQLWIKIAERYEGEDCIAGYDLLNEPLPNWWKELNPKVLPLYRKLIAAIRKVDKKHMIILEGVHWASDFSIFDSFTKEEAANNILLQFHKYWNEPDEESLESFLEVSKRLEVPLFMGEGGENNCEWYTTAFPLYERLHISWNFWTYKKMECKNSPITFDKPKQWDKLLAYLEEPFPMTEMEFIAIFDDFLHQIKNYKINERVFCSLKREAPVIIPAESYDTCDIYSKRMQGADLRLSEPASLLFQNGKLGKVDYQRYNGEEQPEEENLVLRLEKKDKVSYVFHSVKESTPIKITVGGNGSLACIIGNYRIEKTITKEQEFSFTVSNSMKGRHELEVECVEGYVVVDVITIL